MRHPGEILAQDYLERFGLTANQLAKGLGVNRSTVGRLLSCQQRLSPEMAARLGAYFQMSAKTWLQMQADYDADWLQTQAGIIETVRPLVADHPGLTTLDSGGEIVGRRAELLHLLGRAREAQAGRLRAVIVRGVPGIGKTTLVRAVADHLEREGWAVGWASAWEHEGAPALWPWRQLLRALEADSHVSIGSDALKQLGLGSASRDDSEGFGDSHFALFDAMARQLGRRSMRAPLCLVIDDLHAVDHASVRLLQFVATSIPRAPILLLSTCRTVDQRSAAEVGNALSSLWRHAETMELAGLSAASVQLLAQKLAGPKVLPHGIGSSLHARSGGNPLFVEGLVHEAIRRGTGASGRAQASLALQLPDTILATLESRFDALPAGVVNVLRVLCLLGAPSSARLVARMTDRPVEGVVADLRAAADQGVVRAQGALWSVAHGLFAEVLYAQLDAQTAAVLHRRAARLMIESGDILSAEAPRDGQVACHLLKAAELSEEPSSLTEAITWGVRAAQVAREAFDYPRACATLERVLALMAHDVEDQALRSRVVLDLANARRLLGELVLARRAYRSVAQQSRESGDLRSHARAAVGFARTSPYASPDHETIALLDDVATRMNSSDVELAPSLQVEVLTELSRAHWIRGTDADQQQQRELASRALALARQSGSVDLIIEALGHEYRATWEAATVPERTRIVDELVVLGERTGSMASLLTVARWALNLGFELGDRSRVDHGLRRYSQCVEAIATPQLRMNGALRRATVAQLDGRFLDVDHELASLREHGRQAADPETELYAAYGEMLGLHELDRHDRLRSLLPVLREASDRWSGFPAARLGHDLALAWLGEHEDLAGCVDAILVSTARPDRHGNQVHALTIAGVLALEANDMVRTDRVRKLLQRYSGRYAWTGIGYPLGPVDLTLGRLAEHVGDVGHAVQQHYESAVAHAKKAGDILAEARASLALARLSPEVHGELLTWCRAKAKELGLSRLGREVEEVAAARGTPTPRIAAPARTAMFERTGSGWRFGFEAEDVWVRDLRGFEYIVALVRRPGQHVPARELVSHGAQVQEFSTQSLHDEQAMRSYRRHMHRLREDLDEAEAAHDLGRVARLRGELESLEEAILGTLGLGGRSRQFAADNERARVAVTRAIARALSALEADLPALSRHLRDSIHTGSACRYDPDPAVPVSWSTSPGGE